MNDPIEDIKENKKEVVEDFDNEKLLIAWKQYIKLQKEEGKSNFATTLDMNEPILHDNYKIEVLLSNKAQEVMLEKEKMGLLDFLRNKLKNDMIEITTKTNEILKENIPYTNKEKYQQMIEVNPNLEHLKEQLGLDYDF